MDPVRLNVLVNHVPVVLVVTGTFAIVLAMFRARHGIWMYATASLTLAAVAMLPTYFTGGLAARALGGPFMAAVTPPEAPPLLVRVASILIVVAGIVAAVAWRRLVRYPRELRMPWTLRSAAVATALAAAAAVTSVALLGE